MTLRITKLLVGLAVLSSLLATASLAGQTPMPNCTDPTSQMEMNSCSGIAFEKADKALNALWPKIVAAAKERDAEQGQEMKDRGVPTTLEALRSAQHAWIAFRDAECSYEAYAAFGGTMQPLLGSECKTRLTKARIIELQNSLSIQ